MSATVDVIVVGAGAAGCVLASRLSEDRDRSVLLLEAGPDYPTAAASPPEIVSGLQIASSHDWGFMAERPDGRTFAVPRGRLAGGSSSTNATFALRGLPSDYDEWAAAGNAGWSFADVLPFFRRLESDRDFDGDVHGGEGPIPIRRYPAEERTPVQAAFLAAAEALGHPAVVDHNAPNAHGAGPIPTNTEAGIRQSAAFTYLARARGRPNLEVRAQTPVAHVLFEGKRAVGVQLASERLFAGHVILASGAFGSPLILMRSGLGPAEHLIEMGIGVRVDLPGVGAHLADHPLWSLRYATPRPETTTPAPVFQALLTLRTPLADSGRPFDAQIFPTSAARCGILQSSTGALFTLCLSIMKPRSRGRVRLSSAHPTAPPRIRFDHLAEKEDLAALCAVIAEARRLASTPPLAARAIQELYPGPRVTSSEELGLAVREGVGTYHHACGTCRMGPDSDAWAVVSGAGEVRGVSGLSVVDASILPTLPSANIHLPTLMVAERCSELARARLG